MARPPDMDVRQISHWSSEWARPAAVMHYGFYQQQYQAYHFSSAMMAAHVPASNPAVAVAAPLPPPAPPIAPKAVAPKRPHTEVEKATLGANSKDYYVLWMRAYDKPMPDEVKKKCKPLFCEICNVNLNSPVQAKMHYEGKP